MNYFTAWEQRHSIHSIHSIKYNVQLTTYAVGHPQPQICLTQQTSFSIWNPEYSVKGGKSLNFSITL